MVRRNSSVHIVPFFFYKLLCLDCLKQKRQTEKKRIHNVSLCRLSDQQNSQCWFPLLSVFFLGQLFFIVFTLISCQELMSSSSNIQVMLSHNLVPTGPRIKIKSSAELCHCIYHHCLGVVCCRTFRSIHRLNTHLAISKHFIECVVVIGVDGQGGGGVLCPAPESFSSVTSSLR